jgi:hypothetical protein
MISIVVFSITTILLFYKAALAFYTANENCARLYCLYHKDDKTTAESEEYFRLWNESIRKGFFSVIWFALLYISAALMIHAFAENRIL